MNDESAARLVARGGLDAELAALLTALVGRGVPLVVAGRDPGLAESFARALGSAGAGLLVADSLDDVVRLAGGRGGGALPDELRDMGLVVVVRSVGRQPRVVAAHYVRPLERDAGGHVQRRGPAVLATYDEPSGGWSHFWWAVTSELAERAGVDRHTLEDEVDRLRDGLEAMEADPGEPR